MDSDIPLTPDALPPAHVERMRHALVAPTTRAADTACGVIRVDGSVRQMSRTLLSRGRLSDAPAYKPDAFAEILPGRWLYAGLGRYHFGHFLVETLIRLWAVGLYREELDGIVIAPKFGTGFSEALRKRYGAFLTLLTGGLPVHLADHPMRYETLLLPSPGFGPQGWIAGTEIYRREMRGRIAERTTPKGPEKLYISRAQLTKEEKRVQGEAEIEALMARAGYTIYYPEQHSIAEQLATYRSARWVVGGDGSAFHLAAFALPEGAHVGLIQRRDFDRAFNAFTTQLEAFAAAEVTPVRTVMPAAKEDAPQLDIDAVADTLHGAGLI